MTAKRLYSYEAIIGGGYISILKIVGNAPMDLCEYVKSEHYKDYEVKE